MSAAQPPGAPLRARGRLTGRAAVLGVALCALVLTLAYPMREYLAQRSEIAALTEQQQGQRNRVAALEQQRRSWEDPAFVKAQARQRLQYVMPGEVGYVVIDPGEGRSGGAPATLAPAGAAKDSPWYSQLWGSVPAADSAR